MKGFKVIVAAASSNMAIGFRNSIPWSIPSDMTHFKILTSTTSDTSSGASYSSGCHKSPTLMSPGSSSSDSSTLWSSSNSAGSSSSSSLTEQPSTPSSVPTTSSSSTGNGEPSGLRNAVIMGRNTWMSLPAKFKPLRNRFNIVVSTNRNLRDELSIPAGVAVVGSFEEALSAARNADNIDEIFIIGGQSLYAAALASPLCSTIYFTEVLKEVTEADAFFPPISALNYKIVSRSDVKEENDIKFRFITFSRIDETVEVGVSAVLSSSITNMTSAGGGGGGGSPQPHVAKGNPEEQQYLDLVRDVLANGVTRGDRTGTGTISKFGVQMRFSLRDGCFPLLTTKRVFWRGVAEELLWFVQGCTNAKILSDKGINIWDGNGSREFLDKMGLSHREVGDLGPVYGFQWRHFGAAYKDMHFDYQGEGIDQLAECIHKIKTNPEDRRIIMTAWNPSDLKLMALPPCHMFCQFYVANGELSCQMYQRSADLGLGVPFNIASYALLTVMMAQVCNLKAGDFVHSIGDAHVYLNHVDALKEQIQRTPKDFPTITVNPEVTDIDGFKFTDFTINGYNPDSTVKMKMAV